jgi:hypothetical protein
MGWTAPRTQWLAGELVLAADMNRYIRDNLLVSGTEQMSAADSLIVGSGSNRVTELAVGSTGTFLVMQGDSVTWGQPAGFNTKTWAAVSSLSDTRFDEDVPDNRYDELWGTSTEYATITNPGVKVRLWTLVSGEGLLTRASTDFWVAQMRIEMSVDGGATWFSIPSNHGFGSKQGRCPVVAMGYSTERTPTGDLKARVMVNTGDQPTDTKTVSLWNGALQIMAFGTT